MKKFAFILLTGSLAFVSCKKKGCVDPLANNYNAEATKSDGSCTYDSEEPTYEIPTTYAFSDADGNSTVSYSGQTDRLNQLREMVDIMNLAKTQQIDAQTLKDMFANVGDNGNGNFSFSSSKQLKNKCFALDVAQFESWMDSIAVESESYMQTASNGQAGTITSGSSIYLVNANGVEHKQLLEKGLMGAVFMYQALNVYFGNDKMDVDNSSAVDPSAGKYYTVMEHHFDEAFGYFGVDIDFPTTIPTDFWGKYCNSRDAELNSNADIMDNFLKGRAGISNDDLTGRDEAILAIQNEWERISAYQAADYLSQCVGYFGNDNAKFLHALSEAYAFAWNLRYAPESTRAFSASEHADLMSLFKENFWEMTIADLNAIKDEILAKY